MYVKCIDFHDNTNFNPCIFTVIIDVFFTLDLLMEFIISYRYDDTITLVCSYLYIMQIVPLNLQKHHPIPADDLPNDSEALFLYKSKLSQNRTSLKLFYT